VDSIVTLLTSSDIAHVAEGVLQAVELFEAASASADDQRAVRDALMAVADTEPPHPSAGAAVWALGKLGDAELRPLLVHFLARAVGRLDVGGNDVWQAIVALANCGEQSLRVSGGVRDFDENFRRATEFLRRERAV
jgi:HEAT repeat protein